MKSARLIGASLVILAMMLMLVTPCWAFKILIVENDENSPSHGLSMQSCAMTTSGLSAEDVPILFMVTEGMSWEKVCQYAVDNNIDMISRSVAGQDSSHSTIAHEILEPAGIGCVYSYYYGASVEAPGYNISPDREPPTVSTHYGLEFTNPLAGSSSAAAASTAGMVAKLMMDHPGWNFWDARAALRQTADQYGAGVTKERGYGVIDYNAANNVTELEPFGPWVYSVVVDKSGTAVTFKWVDFLQTSRRSTVLVKFSKEPDRNSTPEDGEILYEGDDETYTYVYTQDESVWFAWFTKDVNGNVSYIEPFHKKYLELDRVREPLTLYLNNEGSNAIQDGLSWETAFTRMSDLYAATEAGDKIYVKATDTPYRGAFKLFPGNSYYFDAVGVGNQRGAKKAEVRGSELAPPGAWKEYGLGTPNTYCYKPSNANGFASWSDENHPSRGGVWCVDPATGDVTTLVRGPAKDALSLNEMYWDEGEKKVYVNMGGPIPNGGLEVANTAFIAEIQSAYNNVYERDVYNGIFRFGENGLGWQEVIIWDTSHTISGCRFEYCSRYGVFGIGFHGDPSGALSFVANTFRGNGNDGFFWYSYGDSANSWASVNMYLESNVFVDNGGDGAEINAIGQGQYSWLVFVYQNTFLRNGGKGLHLSGIENAYANVTVKNNISYDNGQENFFVIDSKNFNLTAGYNCNGGGSYGGAWEAQKGPGNIESDPLLVDNNGPGYLQSVSPVIGKGDPSAGTLLDHDGKVFESAPAMGAFEYTNGGVWYVDAVNGSDENAGDFEHPWKTLSKVNGAFFSPGDAIYLMPGSWEESLIVSSSGTSDQHITVGLYGKEGFATIYGGLDFNGKDFIDVSRLYFTDKVAMSGNGCTLSFCVVNGSESDGVLITGASNLLYNNTIYGSAASGLRVQNSCQFLNSIVCNSQGGDLNISEDSTVTGLFNCIKDSIKSGNGTYNDPASTTLWGANPIFDNIATGHFDLQASSPCVDKGSINPGIILSKTFYPSKNTDDVEILFGRLFNDMYIMTLGGGTVFQGRQGILFNNVTIPKDAHILEATMRLNSYSFDSGLWKVKITGEANACPTTFSASDDFLSRKRTNSSVVWSDQLKYSPSNYYYMRYSVIIDSPTLNNIIGEITDLEGWQSGNNLVLFIDDFGSEKSCRRYAYSYNYFNGGSRPELHVTYSTLQTDISIPEDIRGQITPQGGSVDIGAYEFVQ